MTNKEQIEIIKHIPMQILKKKIKHQEKSLKVLKRLIFVKSRYKGDSVQVASERVGISLATGYLWQDRWNKGGYDGLIPHYAGGRPSKMTPPQKEELKEYLKTKDHWTTKEVQDLVFLKFNISYSEDQIRRILHTLGMHFWKPYPRDHRRPEEAEKILKKTSKNE